MNNTSMPASSIKRSNRSVSNGAAFCRLATSSIIGLLATKRRRLIHVKTNSSSVTDEPASYRCLLCAGAQVRSYCVSSSDIAIKAATLTPQLRTGDAGALHQGVELRPHDAGMDPAVKRPLGEAAIGSCNKIFASD